MSWLKTILAESVSLFVDDGRFALAIVAWLVFLWLSLPHLPLPMGWQAPLWLSGLLAILFESVWRRAGRR